MGGVGISSELALEVEPWVLCRSASAPLVVLVGVSVAFADLVGVSVAFTLLVGVSVALAVAISILWVDSLGAVPFVVLAPAVSIVCGVDVREGVRVDVSDDVG